MAEQQHDLAGHRARERPDARVGVVRISRGLRLGLHSDRVVRGCGKVACGLVPRGAA